ncbi:carboxymuconolactone decarboxylase family protein [Conexibacter stalactiti]|uniref:Carboxymuconolactone decarboxylase family protein n=1 Tax=Conexibacter stalactiti TaxID=1940611 RepID=A0ABU4HUB5_9ACTN|nr:carboxymuconolactone decarboxylase family protein [Conexibacter stalactiti]MDW5596414.1 carboxymuconolactone decarboxylase family protein [Conexibacter stalactiti]MEC5037056.1 carboxymuconolactone decarboxylase family protein [Conexibacter stalactiti]
MSNARIPQTDITGIYGAVVKRFSKKQLGSVPESVGVMWQNLPVLRAMFSLGAKTKRWDACDPSLKSFAHMAVAARVGCSFCLDYGYFEAHNQRLDLAKAREVPQWRESQLFTPLERDVLEYAEAATQTPSAVTDELSARLLAALGAPALLELAAFIGFANMTARTNTALGIEAEGLAASCDLRPLAEPSRAVLSTT